MEVHQIKVSFLGFFYEYNLSYKVMLPFCYDSSI